MPTAGASGRCGRSAARSVDDKNKVVIDSPETIAALEYVKQLYATFIPGVLSWHDPNNNKAFLDGETQPDAERHLDLVPSARTRPIRRQQEIAKDMNHANMPIGPVGESTEQQNILGHLRATSYTKYPNAVQRIPALHEGQGAGTTPGRSPIERLRRAAAAGL